MLCLLQAFTVLYCVSALPQQSPSSQAQATASASSCPRLPIVSNFQADKYLGRWYEVQRFFVPFQNGMCVTADYSLLPNCTIGVLNTQLLPNGTVDSISGHAVSADNPAKGSLRVTFPSQGSPTPPLNYNILATDYANYAVMHSCSIIPVKGQVTKLEFSWVLTRKPQVSQVFLDRLHEWLAKIGINPNRYVFTHQLGCVYLPV